MYSSLGTYTKYAIYETRTGPTPGGGRTWSCARTRLLCRHMTLFTCYTFLVSYIAYFVYVPRLLYIVKSVLEASPRPTATPNRCLGFLPEWRTECLDLCDGVRESNERPVTAASTVVEAVIGGNRLELGLSSSAIIPRPRSPSAEAH